MKEIKKYISQPLLIIINDKCNLHCPYCFQDEKRTNKEMSPEVINKIISGLKNNKKLKYNGIVFYGGEPMLSQNIILKFIDSLGENYSYEVMTNGTIDLISFCKKIEKVKNKFTFGFSFDGLYQTNRTPNDIEKVKNNLNYLKKHKFNIDLIWTVGNNCIDKIIDNILYLTSIHNNIKLKRICNLHNAWNKETKEKFIDKLPQITLLCAYLERNKQCSIKLPNYINYPKELNGIIRRGFVCQDSIGLSSDSIDINGDMYPCENRAYHKIGKFGHIFDGIENRPFNFPAYEKTDILYNICTMYNTVEPKIDEALDFQREKYQEYVKKFERLKNAVRN